MMVRVSDVEVHKVTHPNFGGSYVCISPQVLGLIDKMFPNRRNGLAGVIEKAQAEGIMPYGAGDNLFYVGVRNQCKDWAKTLSELDVDGTLIVAPLEEHDFKRLLGIFAFKYMKQMHS